MGDGRPPQRLGRLALPLHGRRHDRLRRRRDLRSGHAAPSRSTTSSARRSSSPGRRRGGARSARRRPSRTPPRPASLAARRGVPGVPDPPPAPSARVTSGGVMSSPRRTDALRVPAGDPDVARCRALALVPPRVLVRRETGLRAYEAALFRAGLRARRRRGRGRPRRVRRAAGRRRLHPAARAAAATSTGSPTRSCVTSGDARTPVRRGRATRARLLRRRRSRPPRSTRTACTSRTSPGCAARSGSWTPAPDYALTDGFPVPGPGRPEHRGVEGRRDGRVHRCRVDPGQGDPRRDHDRAARQLARSTTSPGTRATSPPSHSAALTALGPCPQHRRRYVNVRRAMGGVPDAWSRWRKLFSTPPVGRLLHDEYRGSRELRDRHGAAALSRVQGHRVAVQLCRRDRAPLLPDQRGRPPAAQRRRRDLLRADDARRVGVGHVPSGAVREDGARR